ncbi:diaminopimelate decarboxylase [Streptomyces misionensis]|uniref:diaminopimelate decarboxylase n=1 Tax=Streptomyces misionensis TaxID=67331 RepID=UPI0033F26418
MPISADFERRLNAVLPRAAEHFGTPFHIYDEQEIEEKCATFHRAFANTPYREYYAVKANPNPVVLRLLAAHGFGFDCSSLPELTAAVRAGAVGHDICFTSNNTSPAELDAAVRLGVLINVDDETALDKLAARGEVPGTLCLRVHPGDAGRAAGASYLGDPQSAKFGIRADRLPVVCARARRMGVENFGLHMMLGSGYLTPQPFLLSLDLLLEHAETLHRDLGVLPGFLNLGGGIGIPYRPEEKPFDLLGLGAAVGARLRDWERGTGLPRPRLLFESGRYVTGPHGVLVTRVLNRMSKWREYVGVDAGMSALMRPAMYGAYHHITVPGGSGRRHEVVDVVGSLCENNDKFAQQRSLPTVTEGDLVVIHDTGAHAHSMGFTYNGRLRPQELLLRRGGSVERIRRAETEADYFATLRCRPDVLAPVTDPVGVR